MVWTACEAPIEVGSVCPSMELKGICANEYCTFSDVGYKHPKPEGIAVELIDGCIRILDLIGYIGIELKNGDYGELTNTIRGQRQMLLLPQGKSL